MFLSSPLIQSEHRSKSEKVQQLADLLSEPTFLVSTTMVTVVVVMLFLLVYHLREPRLIAKNLNPPRRDPAIDRVVAVGDLAAVCMAASVVTVSKG
jgi:hypothetical protein